MDRKSRTSRSATLEETNEELSLWKQICTSLVKLEGIQKETDVVVNNINKLHLAVNFEEGISTALSQRLKEYYRGGIDLTSSEARTITDIIEKVSVLIALRDASEYNNVIDPKRKKRKTEGTSVAARQPKQKDKNEEWILAVVISYHADKNKYQVEDVDQDEFGQKQRYMLQPRNVIPVPDGDEMRNFPETSAGLDVLALYPGTTCFYKATVIAPPSKNKDSAYPGNYKVQFEDDNNEVKHVMPEHVLELPKQK
ncbi:SGF29 tudor-like domain-containing protein [Radiomyces spectabilis]|uniref:SGF29 tudor-like domain-containing protein n=1 Tax=Radiomyces spectabilis TaxID=64574 RepID=UPI00221E3F09|nr:SGF29 tudor-like domain-containing protein [Radiomyces spectabilis]KAI8369365.1 SGF29 tudor-like domain-containing protein [Radiomyces spectabilis]